MTVYIHAVGDKAAERALNQRNLPLASGIIVAIIAFLAFLLTGTPVGFALIGGGFFGWLLGYMLTAVILGVKYSGLATRNRFVAPPQAVLDILEHFDLPITRPDVRHALEVRFETLRNLRAAENEINACQFWTSLHALVAMQVELFIYDLLNELDIEYQLVENVMTEYAASQNMAYDLRTNEAANRIHHLLSIEQ